MRIQAMAMPSLCGGIVRIDSPAPLVYAPAR